MFARIDERALTGVVQWLNDSGEPVETVFRIAFEACDCCAGRGVCAEDLPDGPGDAYFAGVPMRCPECAGKRVVPVPAVEWQRMTPEQQRALAHVCEHGGA